MSTEASLRGNGAEGKAMMPPSEALSRLTAEHLTQIGSGLEQTQHLRYGFRVGGIGLLVVAGTVSEVIENTQVYRIPNTALWFSGLINLRGNLVPVFDLKCLFGLGQGGHGEDRPVLVVGQGKRVVGIMVDGLPRAIDTSRRSAQVPPLPPELAEHVRTAYLDAEELWLDLDFEAFFKALGARLAA